MYGGDALTEIYADVLVSLNILFTYIFLVATRVICKIPTNKWGVAISSFLGGMSSLIIFVNELNIILSAGYRIMVAIVLTGIAFLPRSIKSFIKVICAFFGVSFLFGGIMYGIEIAFNPSNIFFVNGTVYFDMSITYLVVSVLVVYGVFLGCNYLLQRNLSNNEIYEIEIYFRSTSAALRGIIDTGNALKDGVMGRPVIVAELKSLLPLFTDEEIRYLKAEALLNVPQSLETRIHFIPCKTVSGRKLLPAIIPRKVELVNGKNAAKTDFVAVAIMNEKVSSGEYNALLYKEIAELSWKENNNAKHIF